MYDDAPSRKRWNETTRRRARAKGGGGCGTKRTEPGVREARVGPVLVLRRRRRGTRDARVSRRFRASHAGSFGSFGCLACEVGGGGRERTWRHGANRGKGGEGKERARERGRGEHSKADVTDDMWRRWLRNEDGALSARAAVDDDGRRARAHLRTSSTVAGGVAPVPCQSHCSFTSAAPPRFTSRFRRFVQ